MNGGGDFLVYTVGILRFFVVVMEVQASMQGKEWNGTDTGGG